MNREQIIQMALQYGFMLSTSYGQEAKKLMPVSDSETIIAFAAAIRAATKEEDAKICEEEINAWSRIAGDEWCKDEKTALIYAAMKILANK